MIKQLTVFLENDKGRLASLCRTLGNAGISMHALTVADTLDYGVARIICDTPEQARTLLVDAGYRAKLVDVLAFKVPNSAGGLAGILDLLDEHDINLEYAYCFGASGDQAIDIIRIDEVEAALAIAGDVGFEFYEPQELYKV
jgi:hypothetical protein